MLVWELVQGDSPVSTRTFEKPFHTIMPVEVMLFTDTHKYTCNPALSAQGFCLYGWFLSRVLQLL